MKPIILTGDRPTGPLHLGHFVGSLKSRLNFEKDHRQFLIIADAQALTDHFARPELVKENVIQVALDYLAVGLDPNLSTFFIQSQVPELCELTFYLMNLVTVSRLQRNPTVKNEIKLKKFYDSVPMGFFSYPVSQAADILAFSADVVPIGEDQKPMIEQTNELARKFNSVYKTECLKVASGLVGGTGRLPGIDGKLKMSKSLGNAIFLRDSSDEVRRKVNSMFTDPKHVRAEDPGRIDGNVVFSFLDVFDPKKDELSELKDRYQKGGVGDSQVKKKLTDILNDLLAPIRTRRQRYESDIGYVRKTLLDGSRQARAVAAGKVDEVVAAMGLRY